MAGPELRCTDLVEVVTEWMDGGLSDDARLAVEEHLAICPHCTAYVAQIRAALVVLETEPAEAPPPAARAALLEAFRRERG